MRPPLVALVALALAAPARAEDPALVAPTGPRTPADERKAFKVPDGFDVQLVASEPDIQKPMQMAFDAKGRLWVTTSYHYPFAVDPAKATDKLFVLSDFGPDGKAKKVETFAADLNIPIGILPLPDCQGCIVSQVGEILKLTDTDGDGKADKREVLFKGFGTRDTHGMTNSFTLMPDGWVYACHGFANDSKVKGTDGHEVVMNSGHTFRFRPDGSRIEVVTRGQVNPFGIAVDPWFNLYTADCHSKPITQVIPGAYYDSFGKPHDGLGYGPHVTRHDHNSTGLCGVAWYDADHFPGEFKGCMFVGNVVTNRINFDKIEWHGSTPVAKELPDFLVSEDRWFRPTDIKLGPDGALYVTDFYNKIIGHYEVDLKHPGRDKDHGRVWRIVYTGKGAKPPKPAYTDLTTAETPRLVELLEHPNLSVRLAAANQISTRKGQWWDEFPHTKPPIKAQVKNDARVHAFLPMLAERAEVGGGEHESYGALPLVLIAGDDPAGVELAVGIARGLAVRKEWGEGIRKVVAGLIGAARNPKTEAVALRDPKVTRAAVEAVIAHPHADFVKPLVELIPKVPADDTHLAQAARIALRNCLRDGDPTGWEAMPTKPAGAVAEVALGIPNGEGASYLGKVIGGEKDPARVAAFAGHIGRYGTHWNREAVLARIDSTPDGFVAYRAMVQGVQAGGKRIAAHEARQAARLAIVQLQWPDGDGPAPADARLHTDAARLLADLPAVAPADFRFADNYDPSDRLTVIATSPKAPQDLRFAAADALMRVSRAAGVAGLRPLLADPTTPDAIRDRIAVAFAGTDDREALLDARDTLKDAPYRRALLVAAALSGTKPGAEVLLDAVKQGKAPARVLQDRQVLERLKAAGVPGWEKAVAELTKGLPPADAKLADLIRQRAGRVSQVKADPAEGAKVFAKNCAACHRIGDQGGKVAPQLDGVGNRGLERLLEDTLDPNRNVDAAFRARVVTLTDGTTKTGLMLRVDGPAVVFADAEGKEFRVPTADIEANRETALSPMPANFGETIPEAEFYHLIAYLMEQKAKEPPK
ncbi:MAG: c-type cytochrome [Gemmataceae bacterium]|nr:c-type cytochrome [Gemmataceae bacterium]